MMKRSYLTPVLSGVLAVTVIGSGAAYYFEFVKDGGSADKDGGKNKGGTSITVDEAAANIEKQLDKAQKIAKGEYDGAYKAEITYSPSADISSQVGTTVGDVSVSIEAKQKDKLTGVDYALNYNAQTVISANLVYDNAGETAYIQIPEFSDAYLTGTLDEITQMMESSSGSAYSDYDFDDAYEASAYTADAVSVTETSPDFEALSNIDFEALLTDLETYADTIKENAPAATDGENKTGEVDGASYELTTKTYTITEADAYKICNAIADKGRADETLKSSFISMGMTESDYNEIWDELVDGIDPDGDDTAVVEVYYSGEDVAGWRAYADDDNIQMINYATDSQLIVDWDFTDSGEQVMSAKGVVDIDGDTINGKIDMNIVDDDGTATKAEISYDNLKATDDVVSGGMTVTMWDDDTEIGKMTYTLNNTSDSCDMSVSMFADGIDLGTVKLTMQETDASDITVPTGTMYNITDESQLEQYVAGMDAAGWSESLKTILGDELYELLFGVVTYDEDYDFDDYDDYDFDDYDFDEDAFTSGGFDADDLI